MKSVEKKIIFYSYYDKWIVIGSWDSWYMDDLEKSCTLSWTETYYKTHIKLHACKDLIKGSRAVLRADSTGRWRATKTALKNGNVMRQKWDEDKIDG